MRIAVTGGKGGTGKSTVAVALAYALSKKYRVLLVDADVECPNDHLLLSIKKEKIRDVFQPSPIFDYDKCTRCGKCAEVCRENAIVQIKGKNPIFMKDMCNGCGACGIVCPSGAITMGKRKIGEICKGKKENLDFLGGEFEIGLEESSPLVNALKKEIKEEEYDFVIIDTAAGTHCSVISALIGCEIAFAVTEPTYFGSHDLDLILKLADTLEIPSKVVLNRFGMGDENLIEKVAKKHKSEIISKVPYSRKIIEQYCRGIPVADESINKIAGYLEAKK
ncbi:ATP-binding protein [Candidatus Micrarchaeota archaeon]|nr:ATP-binding protein [Candidatus Micrarchaeota archaeon]